MEANRRFILKAGAALGAGLFLPTLAACSSSSGGASSSGSAGATGGAVLEGAALEAAAKAEGQVRLYVTDQKLSDAISGGFKKAYPWAKVESIVGTETDLRNRAVTESVSGVQTADVLNLSGGTRQALMKDNIIRAVTIDSESKLDKTFLDATGFGHPMYWYVCVYAYNTNLISAPPTTVDELADSKWKGKIAFDSPQNASTAASFLVGRRKEWGDAKWKSWLAGVKANDALITPNSSSAVADVLRGERALCVTSSINVSSLPKDSPVKAGFYQNLIPVISYAWLTKKGSNPNTGKLFVEWLLSAPGQLAVASSGRTPVLHVDAPTDMLKILPTGTTVMPVSDLSDYYANLTSYLSILEGYWPA